jgi:S-adenosylmethionine hydrolase
MDQVRRIAVVTDFGEAGPYVGQMELRLHELAPEIPVIRLLSDATVFRPDLAAYLLPALVRHPAAGTLYLCVIDPGVGGERGVLAVAADGNWFVGPDNGLFAVLVRRATSCEILRVDWRPPQMSQSFHGRDLFAPIAAMLAKGEAMPIVRIEFGAIHGSDAPDELGRIIYVDHYGNLMTGLRADRLDRRAIVTAGDHRLPFARTFCAVPCGSAFWYENASGLVELAVNQGRADRLLDLCPGDAVTIA